MNGTVGKEYNFKSPNNAEVKYIPNDTFEDCREKYFLSSEYRCVYDIKIRNITNSEEVVLTATLG